MNTPGFVWSRSWFSSAGACVVALVFVCSCLAAGEGALRERVLLNQDWRFQKGDPDAGAAKLIYDVRPEVRETQDNVAADAKPREAEKVAGAESIFVLKPWILPTGNDFIADPARRHARPASSPKVDTAVLGAGFVDSGWRRLNLPHDWAIEGPFIEEGDFGGMGRLPSWGVAWYRRKLDIPASDSGRSVFLEIEGAMSYASVWLNGHLVGGWPYGYSSWQVDLTPYVKFGGVNQLAIRIDNPPSSSRWYPGGGLYRNVWLTKTNPVHVAHWGSQMLTRSVENDAAMLELTLTLANDSSSAAAVSVATEVFELSPCGQIQGQAVARFASASVSLPASNKAKTTTQATLAKPKLWGPVPQQSPNRYVAVTTVSQEGRVLDTYETRFGIRTLRFDPATGLWVNGQHIKIQGVNQHHDLGSLGAAFNLRAAERQLEMLRELGCNAIRMSHNPPAPDLLELCDRLGFLVLNEAFDCWYRKKTPLDFHLIFPDWHEQDLRALIRRDRNHPSVILWSIGNEVGEQYTDKDGAAVARRLCDIVHEEDPSRPTTAAMNYASPDMPLPAELDVIGLNYQGEGIRFSDEFIGTERIRKAPQYDLFRAKFPGKVILGSETASAFSSRGVYLFPVTKASSDLVRDGRGGDSVNHHVSAYELHAVDFGSSAEKVFRSQDQHPFVAGEFVWTGWDHLGEPTPYYSSRGAYCGIIDQAGFKKDRFYLYQSRWRPELPMAHILPHWSWPERVGQVTPVHVFTSGDEAELFLNGKSLGRKKKGAFEYRLRWDEVVYVPGTLEVVAYRNGKEWARDIVRSAGEAARLSTQADRDNIRADGTDLVFVTVRITDAKDLLVPRADNRLECNLQGPGEIIAMDNGDPTSFEPFQLPTRKAFNGLCVVIIRSKAGQAGKIVLTVSSRGIQSSTTTITAVQP